MSDAPLIEGTVTEAQYAYQRIARVKAVAHHYEDEGEKPYIKYGCPVCELLGNKHQVTAGASNCTQCNVNLMWEDAEDVTEQPYIFNVVTDRQRAYNPNYGDDRECTCGHAYYRHFDSYDDNYPCGCKYCPCDEFKEKVDE